jgi:hypothetical protein
MASTWPWVSFARINSTGQSHIVESRSAVVSQREVRGGPEELLATLRAALRESPDVILLGERDAAPPARVDLADLAGMCVPTPVRVQIRQDDEFDRPRHPFPRCCS